MTTGEYSCLTCNDSDLSTGQYVSVKTYTSIEKETTSSSRSSSGEFRSVDISEKKKRIRKLNKLVSKWR